MKSFLFFLLFIFMTVEVFSQTISPKDSLNNLLLTRNKDTTTVNNLILLAIEYNNEYSDSALVIANEALDLSKMLNFKKGQANAFVQLGNYYSIIGNHEESAKKFHIALKMRLELKDNIGYIGILNNLGQEYSYLEKNDSALNFLTEAYEKSLSVKDKMCRIISCENLAQLNQNFGNFVIAMKFYTEALTLNEQLNNTEGIAIMYNNIGTLQLLQKNYPLALEYFNKSLDLSLKKNLFENKANAMVNLGLVYMEMIQIAKARKCLNDAMDYYIETENKMSQAAIFLNLGKLMEKELKIDSAVEMYTKSLSYFESESYVEGIIMSKNNLANLFNNQKQPDNAISYAQSALVAAKNNGLRDDIKESYINLFESYELKKDFEKTYQYYRLYRELNDSIYNIENAKKLTSIEMQFKMDKKQRQHEFETNQKEEELKEQRIYIVFAVIGIVLMMLVAYVFFRSKNIQKRANQLLLAQNRLIINQKNEIELQKDKIEQQHLLVLHQKEEITASIVYAKRIQSALLPADDIMMESGLEYFIYFKPLSIVSGDFYWINRKDNLLFIAVSDCTGHGVPGAFMSMLGITFLNEIVNHEGVVTANEILNELRNDVKSALKQTGKDGESKDGMDIAFTIINMDTMEMQYAGAYNPLYLYRNEELIQLKADRMPIGIHIKNTPFVNNIFQLQKGDIYYLFSDGYHDQMGGNGAEPLKLMTKGFQKILQRIHLKPMNEQMEILDAEIKDWLGNNDQIDDITVMGIRI